MCVNLVFVLVFSPVFIIILNGMKKLLLLLLLCKLDAFAQTIPNGAFENWTSTPFDDPTGWLNSNRESLRKSGVLTTTKVTGATGSAIKLETKLTGTDTMGGYFTNTMGDPTAGEGGIPYSQMPATITGKYTCSMVGSDSAILLVIFKKSGAIVSQNVFKIGGSVSTFTAFSFNLTLAVTPDSVIMAAASSNLIDNSGVAIGSTITFDDLAFGGTGITQVIPNGNFDSWTAMSIDKVNNWEGFGEGISKSSDAYKGSFAAKLETKPFDNGVSQSGITVGKINQSGPPFGGVPYTATADTLFGYYKYSTPGTDSGTVAVMLYKSGSIISGNNKMLPPASTYTYFEIPISAPIAPDTLNIVIMSSPDMNRVAGSMLTIDEVQLKSSRLNTGLFGQPKVNIVSYQAYPNPASDQYSVLIKNTRAQKGQISVYDLNGKKVIDQQTHQTNFIELSVGHLAKGNYFCLIQLESGDIIRTKFTKE